MRLGCSMAAATAGAAGRALRGVAVAGLRSYLRGQAFQNVAPAQKKSRSGIGKNHFARAEALALGDLRFFQIDQAGFRAGDQQAIMRQRVAQRPQAVAIELRADELSVGEN